MSENIRDRVLHSLEGSDPRTSTLKYLDYVITNYLLQMIDTILPQAKKDVQIDYAQGNNIDEIAKWFGLERLSNEPDELLRSRILTFISAPMTSSPSGIQDSFETITGLRPQIIEDFEVQILKSGDVVDLNRKFAEFSVQFSSEFSKFFETVPVNNDGETVTLSQKTNITLTPIDQTGTDGQTLIQALSNFRASSGTFLDYKIKVGDYVIITGDPITYTITELVSGTILTITPQPTYASTGLTWKTQIADPFNAYNQQTDPTHITDISNTVDVSTDTMTLKGTPYLPGTKIDVEYYITPQTSYDTLEEITANLPFFKEIVNYSRAAGVKVNAVELVLFLTSWFGHAGNEVLTVIDEFDNGLGVTPIILESLQSVPYGWNVSKWGKNNWGSNSTTWCEDVFSFTLV